MLCFTCPGCKAILSAPPLQANQTIICESCGQKIRVPSPVKPSNASASASDYSNASASSTLRVKQAAARRPLSFRCEHCGTVVRVRSDRSVLETPHCPKCGIRIGESPSPPPDPPQEESYSEDLSPGLVDLKLPRPPWRYYFALLLALLVGIGAVPCAVIYKRYFLLAAIATLGGLLALYSLGVGLWYQARGRLVAFLSLILCASSVVTLAQLAGGLDQLLRPLREAIRSLLS